MRTVLGLFGWLVLKLCTEFAYIVQHRKVEGSFLIVPVQCHSAIECSFPIFR
jgi:hypothetical protein